MKEISVQFYVQEKKTFPTHSRSSSPRKPYERTGMQVCGLDIDLDLEIYTELLNWDTFSFRLLSTGRRLDLRY